MEYVWLMADQALITGPLISQAVGTRDPFIRIMIPKSSHIPQQYQNIKTLLGNKLELRLLPDENAKVAIAMNEKISGITFSDLKGKIDFDCGFTSNSSDFHKWCNDLFTFYWDRSKKPFFISS
jgi:predicted transcriptional regulator